MIIVAILKHIAGKSADYGAALDYLKYEHDEVLKKPLLDANGNWVLRRDILLEGINCEPELFDVECEMLNAQYHKNQNYNEIKTHHYLISFDPADKDECGLTGEQAQAIGMEYVKANFPGLHPPGRSQRQRQYPCAYRNQQSAKAGCSAAALYGTAHRL